MIKKKRKAMTVTKLWITGMFCVTAALASAQTDGPVFRAKEWSLDVFGSVSIGQETINNISGERIEDDGRLGLGVAGNYFFTRNLGASIEAYTENAAHSFVDNTSGNLTYRFPIEGIRLAPYVFGGGGRQFDPSELWFAQAGAGAEFRFTSRFGVFVDGRYVFTDGTGNIGVGRLGARVSF